MDTGSFDEEYEDWLVEHRNAAMDLYESTGCKESWGMAKAFDEALTAFRGDFGDEEED